MAPRRLPPGRSRPAPRRRLFPAAEADPAASPRACFRSEPRFRDYNSAFATLEYIVSELGTGRHIPRCLTQSGAGLPAGGVGWGRTGDGLGILPSGVVGDWSTIAGAGWRW